MTTATAESTTPRQIKRITDPDSGSGAGLEIIWGDGLVATVSSTLLRTNCPCATCLEKRGIALHEKPLGGPKRRLAIVTHSAAEELDLKSVWAVGNYAIGIRWGDGHDSGIVSYDHLRTLSQTAVSAAPR